MKEPLRKTYKIERELREEYNQRLKRAMNTWVDKPICPDHFKPCKTDPRRMECLK